MSHDNANERSECCGTECHLTKVMLHGHIREHPAFLQSLERNKPILDKSRQNGTPTRHPLVSG